MTGKIKYLIFILAGFIMTTCETPFEVPYNGVYKKYVVTGFISDQPGPFTINISYTTPYSASTAGTTYPVPYATVGIMDADSTNLPIAMATYTKAGKYLTDPKWKGIPGHHYVLNIVTLNYDTLMSYPELMTPMDTSIEIHYEFVKETTVHPEGDRVWLTMKDPPGIKNFYRWEYEGVYEFTTKLSLSTQGLNDTQCWQYEYFHNQLELASDDDFNGTSFDRQITVVPFFSSTPYLITVYTESLTQQAYDYWKAVDKQINNPGGIFAPPPEPLAGNMYCVNNPKLEVLGYFQVSAVKKSQAFMKRDVHEAVKYPKQYSLGPCWIYTNAVEIKCCPMNYPDGWQEVVQ